ncbi:MAG: hypothetical protein VYE49_05860, partial [Pseudomonadota bacterium]|nr:hypothetical protein [Pseudomonadota bacterium]
MTISDRTGASPFLTEPDATCPADFLALAGGGDPLPVGFVRAVGTPILETARDAVAGGGAPPGPGGPPPPATASRAVSRMGAPTALTNPTGSGSPPPASARKSAGQVASGS